jgi:hypothetical protein
MADCIPSDWNDGYSTYETVAAIESQFRDSVSPCCPAAPQFSMRGRSLHSYVFEKDV